MSDLSPALRRRRAGLARSRKMLDLAARIVPPPPGLSHAPRSIHVALLWGIGDAVALLPLIQALKRSWPDAEVTLVGKAWLADIFAGEDVSTFRLDAPWTAFSGKYRLWDEPWRRFLAQFRRLRARRPDLWVTVRFDPRDAALARLSGARAIAGFGAAGASAWLSHDLDLPAEEWDRLYVGASAAKLAAKITGQEISAVPRFSGSRSRHGRPVSICVAFGASHPIRRWDPAKVQAVLDGLIRRGLTTTVIDDGGGPLPAGAARVWTGNLAELKAVLATNDLFVGTDSGPMHIAAALGVPTIGVFGPGSIDRFAPRGPDDRWVAEPIACRPCFDDCLFATPHCLDALSPERVLDEVDRAIARLTGEDS